MFPLPVAAHSMNIKNQLEVKEQISLPKTLNPRVDFVVVLVSFVLKMDPTLADRLMMHVDSMNFLIMQVAKKTEKQGGDLK